MTVQPELDLATPFRKSSYSNGGDNCVEVGLTRDGQVAVRHSKHPELYNGGTIAYLAARELTDDVNELGVIVHGPDHTKLTAHTIDLLHQWDHQRPGQPTITAHRVDNPGALNSIGARITRPHTVITIVW